MRLAYSYIRFSSPEQKKGDSRRRQWEACEDFCKQNSLVLEKSRQFYDEGKSGFDGTNRTEGALGNFLELVNGGRVPSGSVLIVEAFDRLSREDVLTAFNMFTSLLKSGIDVVTLVDRQWYSKDTINRNMGQLFISIGALWAAHNYSALLSGRVGNAWSQKQKLAFEQKKPMTGSCPGWLRLSENRQKYEVIQGRDTVVKRIFDLTLDGWGQGRISNLFNRERVPVWGAKRNKGEAWHYSYIKKVLMSRAVIGEFVPHTGRGGERKPIAEPIKDYYPRIISDDTFLRVANRSAGPKGPRQDRALNLFQGLMFDGDHPKYSMWFRDHGDISERGEWAYVVSDHRRVFPEAPIFSWPYLDLERLVLNYLADMDWSSLTTEQTNEVRQMKKDLEVKEARAAECGRQLKRLVEAVKNAGTNIPEFNTEIREITLRREQLQAEANMIQQQILAKGDFNGERAAALVKKLAADRADVPNRQKLRQAIRDQIKRVELFRQLPDQLAQGLNLRANKSGQKFQKLAQARCVRIAFRNEAERWILDSGDETKKAIRFDGTALPNVKRLITNRDPMGGSQLLDVTRDSSVRSNPVKREEWKSKKGKSKL
jgi:DNA invertase Pin-like site-specific DNA recombinase